MPNPDDMPNSDDAKRRLAKLVALRTRDVPAKPVGPRPEAKRYGEPVGSQPEATRFGQPVGSRPEATRFGEPVGSRPEATRFGQPVGSQPEASRFSRPSKQQDPHVSAAGKSGPSTAASRRPTDLLGEAQPTSAMTSLESETQGDWSVAMDVYRSCQRAAANPLNDASAEALVEKLTLLMKLTADWANAHRRSKSPSEVQQANALNIVSEWAANQALAVTKFRSELVYLNDVIDSENSQFPLQSITKVSVTRVKAMQANIAKLVDQSGLTEAERAAFLIFTGGAMGNNHRMKEGALHAGMLQQAIQKLPAYEDTVYRGYATVLSEIEGWIKSREVVFTTMTSTFVHGTLKHERPHGIIFTIEDSGGRDIQEYSQYKGEKEIIVPAGARFTPESYTQTKERTIVGGRIYEMTIKRVK